MPWPEEYSDTVVYGEREIFGDKDITIRMIDLARLNIWGTLYLNGEPFQNLGGRVDIRNLGMKCDGTDESAAFQAALNTGYPLIVPKGVKLCLGARITIPSNTDLLIDGRIEKIWNPAGSGGAAALFISGSLDKNQPRTSNIKIHGNGSVGAQSFTVGRGIIFDFGTDDLLVKDITVDTYWNGQAFITMGHRQRYINVKVINSALTAGTGGLRFCGGDDFMAIGCHIESGDDCLQFVPGEVSPSLDCRRGAYIGCTGFSTVGRFIVVINAGASEAVIEDCSFIGCHGKSSNRGIIIDAIENAKGSVRRISVRDCSVDTLNAVDAADGTIFIKNTSTELPNGVEVRDITLDNVTIKNPWSAPIAAESVVGLTINNCFIENDRNTAQTNPPIGFSAVDNLKFTNNDIYVSKAGLYTMQFTGNCDNVRMENNEFRNMLDTSACMRIYGGGTDVQIRSNTFYHAPGGTSISSCVRFEAANVNDHIVENNDFSRILAATQGLISVAFGSRVYIKGNKGIPNPLVTASANYVASNMHNITYGTVHMTAVGAKTFQLQDDSKSALPHGAYVDILNLSASGDITIMLNAGAVLTLTGTLVVPPGKMARLMKLAPNTLHSVVWA